MNKNLLFIILLTIAALSLAGTAAYFSVFGLTQLFAAAGLGITILAASLEFAKLVTVSYVYRYWSIIRKSLRGFYVFAVIFIMLLTSIGIYGFLTGAYQQTANKLNRRDSEIVIVENKKNVFVTQLNRINNQIESSNNRILMLTELRNKQETRLDSMYNRNHVTNAKRTESQIENSDIQVNNLNLEIYSLMSESNSINDSIAYYDNKIIELKSSDIVNEIGPYQFIADLTGAPIGKIVNIVALLIICVFDPLAIALLIGINQLTLIGKKNDEYETTHPETTTTTTTTTYPETTTTVLETQETTIPVTTTVPAMTTYVLETTTTIPATTTTTTVPVTTTVPATTTTTTTTVPVTTTVPATTTTTTVPVTTTVPATTTTTTVPVTTTVPATTTTTTTLSATKKHTTTTISEYDINLLVENMIVEHDVFGSGRILNISGRGLDKNAKILFDNFGEKHLFLKYAKLKVIELPNQTQIGSTESKINVARFVEKK